MKRRFVVGTAMALAAACLTACPGAPRARPVKMGDVDTGPTSIEAVRRQLKGTWQLVSLDVYTADGQKYPAQANGVLTYDEFGNLAIKGRITGGEHIEPADLDLTGRVTIDADQHLLRIGGITAATPDQRRVDPKIDPSHVRSYQFDGDLLKTTTKNADGATTATITWKKVG
ncbi:MAG TPA: hypothetical protein VGI12_06085 [Vicinamibacterales bacterium]